MLGDQDRDVDGVVDTARPDHTEHRHQFLVQQRVRGEFFEVCRQRGQEHLDRRRHREPGPRGQFGRLLPQRVERDLVAAAECEADDGRGLLLGEQARAHSLELGDHRVVDLVVDDARLLGRADHRRVKGFRDQDVDDGAPHVGCLVDVDGGVAGSDAQSRLPGRIGQRDDLRPAGHPEEVDLVVGEQIMGDFVGFVGNDLQRPGRHPCRLGRLAQDLDTALTAPHCVR